MIWGPWIDHDGKGCPLPVGIMVEVEREGPPPWRDLRIGTIITPAWPEIWDWSFYGKVGVSRDGMMVWARVLRYRIRRYPAADEAIKSAIAAADTWREKTGVDA